MFSREERVNYRKNQLGEVICQLRFPEILTIETNIPADFQEAIRDAFPRYSLRKETPMPKLSGVPGNLQLENELQTYILPGTGGPGIYPVILVSVTFIITPLVYISIRRRKRERRGDG